MMAPFFPIIMKMMLSSQANKAQNTIMTKRASSGSDEEYMAIVWGDIH